MSALSPAPPAPGGVALPRVDRYSLAGPGGGGGGGGVDALSPNEIASRSWASLVRPCAVPSKNVDQVPAASPTTSSSWTAPTVGSVVLAEKDRYRWVASVQIRPSTLAEPATPLAEASQTRAQRRAVPAVDVGVVAGPADARRVVVSVRSRSTAWCRPRSGRRCPGRTGQAVGGAVEPQRPAAAVPVDDVLVLHRRSGRAGSRCRRTRRRSASRRPVSSRRGCADVGTLYGAALRSRLRAYAAPSQV